MPSASGPRKEACSGGPLGVRLFFFWGDLCDASVGPTGIGGLLGIGDFTAPSPRRRTTVRNKSESFAQRSDGAMFSTHLRARKFNRATEAGDCAVPSVSVPSPEIDKSISTSPWGRGDVSSALTLSLPSPSGIGVGGEGMPPGNSKACICTFALKNCCGHECNFAGMTD